MSHESVTEHNPMQPLDADAVCVQCGTVNPEGTLICRSCGNNLRDQRAHRLAAHQEFDAVAEPMERRRILLGLLALLGILLILWTTLNIDRVTDWVISFQMGTGNLAEQYWSGDDAPLFEEMLRVLESKGPTGAEAQEALNAPVLSDMDEGIYVIGVSAGELGYRPIGTAYVQLQGDRFYFVAQLRGEVEVRGVANWQGSFLKADWDDAGARHRRTFHQISGVVTQQSNGLYDGYGRSASDDSPYSFVASRVAD